MLKRGMGVDIVVATLIIFAIAILAGGYFLVTTLRREMVKRGYDPSPITLSTALRALTYGLRNRR